MGFLMSRHDDAVRDRDEVPTFTVGLCEAARLSGLSGKTLLRRSREGEPTGLIKNGRRVLFLRHGLEAWLERQAQTQTTLPQPSLN